MAEIPNERLWNAIPDRNSYPDNEKWYSHLLDQYKLYVEMADRISQRRTTANSYFLSVNSAILAFVGYLTSKNSTDNLWLLSIAGITLSVLWHSIITSYRDLNSAKWAVVHEIEKRLPISPYDAEWEAVERGKIPSCTDRSRILNVEFHGFLFFSILSYSCNRSLGTFCSLG
jgi:hypothetical protein